MRSSITYSLHGGLLTGDMVNDKILIATIIEKVVLEILSEFYTSNGVTINTWSPGNLDTVDGVPTLINQLKNNFRNDLLRLLNDLNIYIREDCLMKTLITNESIFLNVSYLY
jgi:hypothetical protein